MTHSLKILAAFGKHRGPEKSRPKNLVKSNKSISQKKFFLTKFHFLRFQKKFKTAKNAISHKKDYDFI